MNLSEWFADSGYWLAWLNRDDDLYVRAHEYDSDLPSRLVTTEAILFEMGNAMSRPPLRTQAISFLSRIRHNARILIVPVGTALFQRAVDLFATRTDQTWGLVDCVSFIVMRDRGITEALAYDRHFEQAGFRALLRD